MASLKDNFIMEYLPTVIVYFTKSLCHGEIISLLNKVNKTYFLRMDHGCTRIFGGNVDLS